MVGSLWNAFSGINSFEKALTAESNNSTNTNTVGYKSSDVRFEDLMYKTSGTGTGAQVETVFKRFHQGDIKPTGHSLDIGIEGKGYFIVNDQEDATFYTRAGNFQMDSEGFLQTPDSLRVQGLNVTAPQVISSDPDNTRLSSNYVKFLSSETIENENFLQTINARLTDYTKTAESSGVSGDGYKSASTKIIDIEALIVDYKDKLDLYRSVSTDASSPSTNQITNLDFRSFLSELNNQDDFIKVNIGNFEIKQQFDTDIDTTMRLFADQITKIKGMEAQVDPSVGVVTVSSLVPAKEIAIYDPAVNNKNALITEVQAQSLGTGYGIVESSRAALKEAIEDAGAELIEITSTISLLNNQVTNLDDIQMKLTNLNLSEYSFGTISTDKGAIYLSDGDNKFLISKLQTAFFRNDQGLEPQGDNLYKVTLEAGNPQYAGNVNTLHSNSLEVSNTDNAETMTNLLTYQKAFEANAKSITTSDELLRTAINLRK